MLFHITNPFWPVSFHSVFPLPVEILTTTGTGTYGSNSIALMRNANVIATLWMWVRLVRACVRACVRVWVRLSSVRGRELQI